MRRPPDHKIAAREVTAHPDRPSGESATRVPGTQGLYVGFGRAAGGFSD
jgi:hypothetical protein